MKAGLAGKKLFAGIAVLVAAAVVLALILLIRNSRQEEVSVPPPGTPVNVDDRIAGIPDRMETEIRNNRFNGL